MTGHRQSSEGADSGPPVPADDLRRMLTLSATRPDRAVGRLALTQQVWQEFGLSREVRADVRGRVLRGLVEYLLEAHHQRASAGETPCPICGPVTSPGAWQVIWLSYKYDTAEGFRRRLQDRELIELVRYVTSECDPTADNTLKQAPMSIQRIAQGDGFPELVRACPRRRRGVRGSGRTRTQMALTYSSRWLTDRRTEAVQGLLAHLRARDELVRAYVASWPELVAVTEQPAPDAIRDAPATAEHKPRAAALRRRGAPPMRQASPPTGGLALRRSRAATWPGGRLSRQFGTLAGTLRVRRMPAGWGWLALALALAVLASVAASWVTAVSPPAWPLVRADLSGYLVAEQYSLHEQRALTVMDLRTAAWHQLWSPEDAAADDGQQTPSANGQDNATAVLAASMPYGSPSDPVYAPATGLLALVWQSSGGNSVWIVPLRTGPDGWPVADAAGARELVADCTQSDCATLAWTPSGRWLLYDGANGLVAIDPATGETRQVTRLAGDGWPACSPDGRWLAYQRARNLFADIAVLPTEDCLPTSGDGRSALYLEGYRPSWRPAWSPDGRALAFVSNIGGADRVYIAMLSALFPAPDGPETSAAVPVSPGGCRDPTWAPRTAGVGAVVIATCDAPTPDNHHGTLLISPEGDPSAWQVRVGEGVGVRITPMWLPARFGTVAPAPSPTNTPGGVDENRERGHCPGGPSCVGDSCCSA